MKASERMTPEEMEAYLLGRGIDIDSLTIANDRLFGMVMRDERLCKGLMERALGIRIDSLTYHDGQVTADPGQGSKWVRFDVVATDDSGTAYDVEMQSTSTTDLALRSRYYQACLDTAPTVEGTGYCNLRTIYVLFICLSDPFGRGLRRYTFRQRCDEDSSLLGDRATRVFLNASGVMGEESDDILAFLAYLKGDTRVDNAFVDELRDGTRRVLAAHEGRLELMKYECDIADALYEGHEKGFAEGLEQGREEGKKLARQEVRALYYDLASRLRDAGRYDELLPLLSDAEALARVAEELGVEGFAN